METQNRLLAMLNSVSLPSSANNPSSTSSSAAPKSLQNQNNQGVGSQLPKSPREPSPTPPPPNLLAAVGGVSLQDLFKSIGSLPVSSSSGSEIGSQGQDQGQGGNNLNNLNHTPTFNQANQNGPPPSSREGVLSPQGQTQNQTQAQSQGQEQGHQAKLLGMLKSIGSPQVSSVGGGVQTQLHTQYQPQSSGPSNLATGTGSRTGTPIVDHPPSGMSTPNILGSQNLLDIFKNGGNNGPLSPQPPIITHTNLPMPTTQSRSSSQAQPSASAPAPAPAPISTQTQTHPQHAQKSTPPPTSSESSRNISPLPKGRAKSVQDESKNEPSPIQKSMFDFVSPFDVFEKPASPARAPNSQATVPSNNESKSTPPPRASSNTTAQASGGDTSVDSRSKASDEPAADPSTEKRPVSNVGQSTSVIQGGDNAASPLIGSGSERGLQRSATGKKGEVNLLWQVGKIASFSEGKGPQTTGSRIDIDISKPNHESLIVGSVRVNPTTIMKAENVGFTQGRSVALTPGWVAYALSRGRVRLIDSATGARLVLQLPCTTGQIVDISATSERIAIVSPDSSVSVYKVPARWYADDPECQLILHVAPEIGEGLGDDGIGSVKQVEWIRKDGEGEWLGIGGDLGVILIRPGGFGGQQVGMREVVTGHKVLQTSGNLVAFCLNQTHQAIGLLSSTSQFTLYSVAYLARVWNRVLPSSTTNASAPSSVSFCESNVLVGRGNNSTYDLIQITLDVAILSTITITSPSPSKPAQHFTKATYDATNLVLWVAVFGRGSLYGFKYALKGVPPIKSPKDVVGFYKMVEYPLEPILSFVLGAPKTNQPAEGAAGAEIFFATPTGFSQAFINLEGLQSDAKDVTSAIGTVLPAPSSTNPSTSSMSQGVDVQSQVDEKPSVPTPKGRKDSAAPHKKAATPADISNNNNNSNNSKSTASTPVVKPTSTLASPAAVKTELSSGDEPGSEPGNGAKEKGLQSGRQNAGLSMDDLASALKKTEDSINNKSKQSIQKEIAILNLKLEANTMSSDKRVALGDAIAAQVQRQMTDSLASVVGAEVKGSILPAIRMSLQDELRTVVGPSINSAVTSALQSLPKELERGLGPHISRTVGNLAQPAIERALQESLQHTLLPSITASTARIYDQLSADVRSEMLQIRKEIVSEQSDVMISTKNLIQTMASSISDLKKQVSSLSDQISKISVPAPIVASVPPAVHSTVPIPLNTSHQQPHPYPPPSSGPAPVNPAQLEDAFLTALAGQTTAATLGLVSEYFASSDTCLPTNGGKGPLSQAVILTLLHRLAMALVELNPSDPMFRMAASWEHRAVNLLDARDPGIGNYLPRVVPVIQGLLNTVLTNLNTRYGNEPSVQVHRAALAQVSDILAHKAQM